MPNLIFLLTQDKKFTMIMFLFVEGSIKGIMVFIVACVTFYGECDFCKMIIFSARSRIAFVPMTTNNLASVSNVVSRP